MDTNIQPNGVSGDSQPQNVTETQEVTSPSSSGETLNPTVTNAIPYDRFAEVNQRKKTLEEENAQLRAQLSQKDAPAPTTEIDPSTLTATERAQIAAARKLYGIPDEDQIAQIAMKKATEIVTQELQAKENIRKMDERVKELKSKYPGDDDLPAFDPVTVIEFGQQRGIFDLETAYEKMHEEKIIAKKAREFASANTTPYVETPSSSTVVLTPKGGKKDFSDLSLEDMRTEFKKLGLLRESEDI